MLSTCHHYTTEWSRAVFAASGVNRDKLRVVPEAVDVDFFNPNGRDMAPRQPTKALIGRHTYDSMCT